MIRVFSVPSEVEAAASIAFSSAIRSCGAMRSGSKRIWKLALAGQISVTPAMPAALTALVIDSPVKKEASDISSDTSPKICSSPP